MIRAEAKQFEPGHFLGTEISYAKKFKVSRPTVRKAIDCLIADGIVSRIAGVGLEVTHKQNQEIFDKKLLIMVAALDADDGLFTKVVMGAIDTANEYGYGYHILNNLEPNNKYNTLKNLDMNRYAGFGDYRIASAMRHPLTTIKVPGYKMGCEAAKLIFEENDMMKKHKIILDVQLEIRETTALNSH